MVSAVSMLQAHAPLRDQHLRNRPLRASPCARSSSSSADSDDVPTALARMEEELAEAEESDSSSSNDSANDHLVWVAKAREAAQRKRQERAAVLGSPQKKRTKKQSKRKAGPSSKQHSQHKGASARGGFDSTTGSRPDDSPSSMVLDEGGRSPESHAQPFALRSRFKELTSINDVVAVMQSIPSDAAAASCVALERLASLTDPASLEILRQQRPVCDAVNTVTAYANELLDTRDITTALYSIARIGGEHSFQSSVESLANELAYRLDTPEPQAFIATLDALARAKVNPPKALQQRISADISSSPMWAHALTPQSLAALLHACATLRCTHLVLDAVDQWLSIRVGSRPECPLWDFDAPTVSACLWALAVQEYHDLDITRALWHEVSAKGPISWSACKQSHLTQLYQAALAKHLDTGEDSGELLKPTSVRKMAEESWFASGREARSSEFGREVATTLVRLRGNDSSTIGVEKSLNGFVVDAFLEREKIAVEADGPTHFLHCQATGGREGGIMTGQTALKRRMLRRMGYSVAVVEFWRVGSGQAHAETMEAEVARSLEDGSLLKPDEML